MGGQRNLPHYQTGNRSTFLSMTLASWSAALHPAHLTTHPRTGQRRLCRHVWALGGPSAPRDTICWAVPRLPTLSWQSRCLPSPQGGPTGQEPRSPPLRVRRLTASAHGDARECLVNAAGALHLAAKWRAVSGLRPRARSPGLRLVHSVEAHGAAQGPPPFLVGFPPL